MKFTPKLVTIVLLFFHFSYTFSQTKPDKHAYLDFAIGGNVSFSYLPGKISSLYGGTYGMYLHSHHEGRKFSYRIGASYEMVQMKVDNIRDKYDSIIPTRYLDIHNLRLSTSIQYAFLQFKKTGFLWNQEYS